MATSSFGLFAMLMMLTSGSGDLLDQISTDAYWKAKAVQDVSAQALIAEIAPAEGDVDIAQLVKQLGSGTFAEREQAGRKILATGPRAIKELEKAQGDPDPEIANRVRNLIRQIQVASKGNQVRRLMAIRTLGEMRKAEALPVLRALADSKEMFVADYARRAIAAIEGKPLPPRDAGNALAKDLAILPGNCGIVAQFRGGGGQPVQFDKMFAMLGPVMGGQNPDDAAKQLIEQIIGIAEQIGNVRFDGLTVGVSDDVGDNSGFVVVIARGQYDPQAVDAFLGKMERIKSDVVDGTKLWAPEKGMAILFPSSDRAMLLGGPAPDKLPTKSVLAALQTGRHEKGLSTNAQMTQLMGKVDTRAALWGIMRTNDEIKRVGPIGAAFDTVTLVGKQEKDAVHFEVNAQGEDAAKVTAAVAEVNKGLDEARKSMPEMVKMLPPLKPLADFVMSVKCEAQGKTAKLTARMEGGPAGMMMAPMMFFGAHARPMPPQVMEAPPAKVEVKPE